MRKVVASNWVDLDDRQIKPIRLTIEGSRIAAIEAVAAGAAGETFLIPGFIDAHIHIESSMLTPSQFARVAVRHGTVATVSDPHEIANVLGVSGVDFMLADAARVPMKFHFGAPSCVPATSFETAGAELTATQTARLLDDPRIGYLSEMMNFPGVLGRESNVMAKIAAAQQRRKPIDGHAPGLRGDDVIAYAAAGITTDHECVCLDEAADKLAAGMLIQIREGSAARNFDALWPLIDQYPGRIAFCSDDKHPDELLRGHINELCQRAVANGCDVFHVLRAACVVPVQHYGLNVGQIRVGDPADFIELGSLETFDVRRTWIDGICVAQDGHSHIDAAAASPVNQFACQCKTIADFEIAGQPDRDARVIVAHDGLLTTSMRTIRPRIVGGKVVADPDADILKIANINRYADVRPVAALIQGFGLRRGAIASSVGHDCHNILAVGVDDESIAAAVNAVIAAGGGLAVHDGSQTDVLPLPIAGLMSAAPCEIVAAHYESLDSIAKNLGCPLRAPFMTLSFMALLVIPSLKLSDRGLFDGDRFEPVKLWC